MVRKHYLNFDVATNFMINERYYGALLSLFYLHHVILLKPILTEN